MGVFICDTDLLVEIHLDEHEGFPSGLEKDVVALRDFRACVKRLEQLPRSYQSHIYHQGDYFLIYFEWGYDYGKGVVLGVVRLLCCLHPEGHPRLFWICSNYKMRSV